MATVPSDTDAVLTVLATEADAKGKPRKGYALVVGSLADGSRRPFYLKVLRLSSGTSRASSLVSCEHFASEDAMWDEAGNELARRGADAASVIYDQKAEGSGNLRRVTLYSPLTQMPVTIGGKEIIAEYRPI